MTNSYKHPLFKYEVLPEQVKAIETLKHKALHITIDFDPNKPLDLISFMTNYKAIVKKFIQENNITNLGIKVQKVPTYGTFKYVVILKNLD